MFMSLSPNLINPLFRQLDADNADRSDIPFNNRLETALKCCESLSHYGLLAVLATPNNSMSLHFHDYDQAIYYSDLRASIHLINADVIAAIFPSTSATAVTTAPLTAAYHSSTSDSERRGQRCCGGRPHVYARTSRPPRCPTAAAGAGKLYPCIFNNS